MTISEQIREAAAKQSPINHLHFPLWETLMRHKAANQHITLMATADLRTFMLLVAEALE